MKRMEGGEESSGIQISTSRSSRVSELGTPASRRVLSSWYHGASSSGGEIHPPFSPFPLFSLLPFITTKGEVWSAMRWDGFHSRGVSASVNQSSSIYVSSCIYICRIQNLKFFLYVYIYIFFKFIFKTHDGNGG